MTAKDLHNQLEIILRCKPGTAYSEANDNACVEAVQAAGSALPNVWYELPGYDIDPSQLGTAIKRQVWNGSLQLMSCDDAEVFQDAYEKLKRAPLSVLQKSAEPRGPLAPLSKTAAQILDYIKNREDMPTYEDIAWDLRPMGPRRISNALKELDERFWTSKAKTKTKTNS